MTSQLVIFQNILNHKLGEHRAFLDKPEVMNRPKHKTKVSLSVTLFSPVVIVIWLHIYSEYNQHPVAYFVGYFCMPNLPEVGE